MTNEAKVGLVALKAALQSDLNIPAENAICAALELVSRLRLGIEDAREMLDYLRCEWGMDRKRWAELVVQQLKVRPNTPYETLRDIIV